MLIEQKETEAMLRRIVRKLTADLSLHEDLFQEALIDLWQTEERRPGQRSSWYFQGCQFHLQNYLTQGRSLDSLKHRRRRVALPEAEENLEELLDSTRPDGVLVGEVSGRDILSVLGRDLPPFDKTILRCLGEGLGPSAIAAQLNVSHTCVIKHRRKIRDLAVKYGLAPEWGNASRQASRSSPRKRGKAG